MFHVTAGPKDDWGKLRLIVGLRDGEEIHRDNINVNSLPAREKFLHVMEAKAGVDQGSLSVLERDIVAAARTRAAEEAEPIEPPESAPRDDGQLPADLIQVPGLIGDIIEFNLRTAIYPQPELALAGALSLMAVITGRKVQDHSGLRTNLYAVGLAPAGAGKENARKINKRIIEKAGAPKMVGNERIGSHSGLVVAMADNLAVLFQLDEFGKMLKGMQSPKNLHMFNVNAVLLTLYSSADAMWRTDAYADAKKAKDIINPHCCIYGTSTPEDFWETLTAGNVRDGLIPRLAVFESSGYVDNQDPNFLEEIPEEIVGQVKDWCFPPTNWIPGGGNLEILRTVPHKPDAKQRMKEHVGAISSRRKTEPSEHAAIWSRSAEKAAKFALLRACSAHRASPIITLDDVNWGIRLANHLTRRMIRKVFDYVSENDTEARTKRVLRILRESPEGIPREKLTYKTRWLTARDRRDVLDALISSGSVVEEAIETSKPGPKKKVLRAR